MSYCAYSEFERKNVVFADENPKCKAKLILKSRVIFQGKKLFIF